MRKKLTKRQQLAIAIAKDVIKQIQTRQLRVSNHGSYCEGEILGCQITPEDQVKKHLPLVRENCDICAKGAIFLSYIELKNKVTFGRNLTAGGESGTYIQFGGGAICDALSGAFTKENLDLIEDAFERWGEGESRAAKLGRKYKTPARRMVAICENIIENKGEFVP